MKLGYNLLTPKGMDDDLDRMMDKAFWKKVLEPVKKSEGSWLKMMFPEDDPNLSPKHPGL